MAHVVFVSHAEQDRVVADAVCAELESKGIPCWVAHRNIVAGQTWGKAIIDAIAQSRLMVLIFSSHANHSPHVTREAERALHRGVPILPIRIENVMPSEDLEYYLSATHWLEAVERPIGRHFEALRAAVMTVVAQAGRVRPDSPQRLEVPPARAIVTSAELAIIHEHCRNDYPKTAVGFIVARGLERRLIRARNIQDELHRRDPVKHPRDSRTAFYVSPQDLLALGKLEGEGFVIVVIYYANVDVGASLSETTRRQAMLGDEPVHPEAAYVVVSVINGRVGDTAAFVWNAALREYVDQAM